MTRIFSSVDDRFRKLGRNLPQLVVICILGWLTFSVYASIKDAALEDNHTEFGRRGWSASPANSNLHDMMHDDEGSVETYEEDVAAPMMAPMMTRFSSASESPKRSRSSMRSVSFAKSSPDAISLESTIGSAFLDGGSSSDNFDASSVPTMLVRTGNLDVETERDLESLTEGIEVELAKIKGAYIERRSRNGGYLMQNDRGVNEFSSSSSSSQHRVGQSISMTIRVPVESFFDLILALKGKPATNQSEDGKEKSSAAIPGLFRPEEIASSSDEVSDVTGSYVDVAARATALRSTHKRLLVLMQKANDVDTVLKVQRELSSVTQQLEAKEARLKRLSDSATLSTLRLNLRQTSEPPRPPISPRARWSIRRTFVRAFHWLGRRLRNFIDVLIFTFVAAVIPLIFFALAYCCFPQHFRRFVVYPLEATKKWLFSGIQKASSAFSRDSEHDNTK